MANVQLDKVHSTINFQIKHLMVSRAKGEFKEFDVDFQGDFNDLDNSKVKVTIDASSVNTNNEQRDGHLKSPDFFDIENYPNITFESTSVKKDGDDYVVTGDLTINDVTKEVSFNVEFGGIVKEPMAGNMVAGVDVEGKINREDFGLTWNAPLETGGVLLSKDVKIIASFEFVVEQ